MTAAASPLVATPAGTSTPGSTAGPHRLHRTTWLTAPALLAGYGLIRLIPGAKRPGIGWTSGHSALLAGLLLFGLLLHRLYRLTAERGRIAAPLGLSLSLVGLAASLAQTSIDLYVGLRTSTKAQQNHLFAQIQAHPGVLPAVYQIGPLFFYVGLLALLTVLAARRRLPVRSPLLVLAGTVAMAASLDLMPVGAALYALALAPLRRAN
ncbi:hypothetical protein [Kitasatospora sp. NBC_01266]|uniref:hypothetical protein n=1 Tax=Kitasatospora sp. NBC_01266 TaxID=2903572 RepID=UPI002E37CC98|nr:hypothetical protein [Kitasatospora sp. NBC_01266]